MLQISTGMYFRPGVPVYEHTHREVFFTNIGPITNGESVTSAPVELPIGRFTFATTLGAVNSVTVEVVDRLEQLNEDGSGSLHLATGGTEHLDDAVDVAAFTLNVTMSRDAALVRRLVPEQISPGRMRGAAGILRGTFDPGVVLSEDDIARARRFAEKLLTLDRRYYEASIRAIRTVVDASLVVADEPGLSYTLYVAALESLAPLVIPAETTHDWDRYDGTKRKLFEKAFSDSGLDQGQAETIRAAVMEVDQLSLRRRFSDLTLAYIARGFYRAEAANATLPIRAIELPHALKVAYDLRSKNVHVLQELAPELWAIADRSDTHWFEGRRVLGLEGLRRLAQHVITQFVERSPSKVDDKFTYRDHVPGVLRVPLAPQYWIGNPEGFSASTAPMVLNGLCETLLDPEPQPPDLTRVLERIEQLLSTTPDAQKRIPMVAIYCIWHVLLDPQHHRPNAESVIAKYRGDLARPSGAGFAARLLAGYPIEWNDEELLDLVEQRRSDLTGRQRRPLPPKIDAALLVLTAVQLWDSNQDRASMLISDAVEMLPGDPEMLALEREGLAGMAPTLGSVASIIGIVSAEPSNAGESNSPIDDDGNA